MILKDNIDQLNRMMKMNLLKVLIIHIMKKYLEQMEKLFKYGIMKEIHLFKKILHVLMDN